MLFDVFSTKRQPEASDPPKLPRLPRAKIDLSLTQKSRHTPPFGTSLIELLTLPRWGVGRY
jgi:hypothetical protein